MCMTATAKSFASSGNKNERSFLFQGFPNISWMQSWRWRITISTTIMDTTLAGIVRAAWANLRAGKIEQGGSTLTQQLAKNTLLDARQSYWRKLRELWLARKIEQRYSKAQILEFYVNRIYWGSGFYGAEEASQGYFGKSANELSLSDAALLAGITAAPSVYSPHAKLDLCLKRRESWCWTRWCATVSPRPTKLRRPGASLLSSSRNPSRRTRWPMLPTRSEPRSSTPSDTSKRLPGDCVFIRPSTRRCSLRPKKPWESIWLELKTTISF